MQLYVVGININNQVTKMIQDFIDQTFNARHKGVRAVFYPPYNESGIVSSLLAGAPVPVVVSSCCTDWPVILPFLERLDPYLKKDNINPNIWRPGQLSRFQEPDGLYGLPEDLIGDVYLYRQDILDELGLPYPEPGWTLADAEKLWRACSGEVHGQWRYGTTCPWPSGGVPEGLPTAIAGFGGQFQNADRTVCLMDQEPAIRAGEFWFNLVWDKVATWGDGWPNPAIYSGQLVFTTGAEPTIIQPVLQFGDRVKWDFIPWPIYPARPVAKLHDNFYGMLASAPNKEIAWEMLKWAAIETEWSRFYMKLALAPPALPSLAEEWLAILRSAVPLLRTKHIEYWVEGTLNGYGVYDFEFFKYNPTDADNVIAKYWPMMWNRQMSVSEGFTEIAHQINTIEQIGAVTAAAAAKEEAYESRALQVAPSPTSHYPAPPATGVGVQATDARALILPAAGGVTMLGDGTDVYGTSDNCTFACFPLTATEGEWTCRVTAINNLSCTAAGLPIASGWLKVGLMAASTLADDPALVAIHVTGANGIEWLFRSYPGIGAISSAGLGPKQNGKAVTALTATGGSPAVNLLLRPVWLKLRRFGNAWTPFASLDGRNWTQLAAPVKVEMAGCWFGVFACAHNSDFNNKGYIRATVDQVSFTPVRFAQIGASGTPPAAGAVPSAWATMPPQPSLAIPLPGGVSWTSPLPTTPAIAALFKSQPATQFAWAVLSAIYNARGDLQSAFPNKAGFQVPLLQWATTWGVGFSGGADGDAPYLAPFKAQLQALYKAVGGK